MGLLQQLLGGNRQATRRAPGFRSYVQVVDGDAAYDTAAEVLALITGTAHADFRKIWEMTVPAQQLIRWGYGTAGLPHNQGYMWFTSADQGTDLDIGILRLQQANARETRVLVVAEIPDSSLHLPTASPTVANCMPTDRNTMVALPEKVEYPLIGEDSKLQLTYALTTAATTHDNVDFRIPITVYQ
jgi:hypothetical protein